MNLAAPRELKLGWFHRYPARFAPDTIVQMFSKVETRVHGPCARLLDPFAGTGATLAAARQYGWESVGVELSQLGVLISSVRLDPPKDLGAAMELVESWVDSRRSRRAQVCDELEYWLGRENALKLGEYLGRLDGVEDEPLRRWVTLALSSALRPASRWLSGSIRPQTDRSRVPPPLDFYFLRSARKLVSDCRLEQADGPKALLIHGDARMLPMQDESISAVVTSPPYWTMYDYFDVQRLSYLAFGWPVDNENQVGRAKHISMDGDGFCPPDVMREWYWSTFNGEYGAKGRALRAYVVDMALHLGEVHRVLEPGGLIVYSVANSQREGRRFDLAGALVELMTEAGFAAVHTESRPQSHKRILPVGRDSETGRFSISAASSIDEKIIVAQKPWQP